LLAIAGVSSGTSAGATSTAANTASSSAVSSSHDSAPKEDGAAHATSSVSGADSSPQSCSWTLCGSKDSATNSLAKAYLQENACAGSFAAYKEQAMQTLAEEATTTSTTTTTTTR